MDPPVSRLAATRSVMPGDKAMRCSQSSLPIRKRRKPPPTITSSHIEHFRHIGLSTVRSTIDRTARSQFDIVNAIYLRVRAFARCGLCRRSGQRSWEISGRAQLRFRVSQSQDLYDEPEPVRKGTKNAETCGYEQEGIILVEKCGPRGIVKF